MADEEIIDYDENYFVREDHIKAMEVIEDSILAQGKDKVLSYLNFEQGNIFKSQSRRTENNDVKFTFLLGSVECFAENDGFSSFSAVSLFELGQQLGSSLYYKKSIDKAKEYLSVLATFSQLELNEQKSQKDIERLVKDAESMIVGAKDLVRESPVKICEPKASELKNDPDPGLKSYWMSLNDEFKRNFMKVSTAELISFVEGIYGTEGRDALEQVLTYAREKRKWRFWMCRKCSKKFSSPEECKNHLGKEHGAEFKPYSRKDMMAQGISKVWARKLTVGGWEPVNATAAVEMIKNRLDDVRAFSYENGWSQEWPLAADEERSQLLQEIRLLLVSFWKRKILSCSIRDWMMQFPVKHLAQFKVSKHTLTDCHLMETPQSICFLGCRELNQILDVLKNIKCERDDGTDLVCKAVDSFCSGTRVKEKIDVDPRFSFLLLDKRLLQCKIIRFDDEGAINVFDPVVHYAKSHSQGVDILSWLDDYSSEGSFRFPKPIRTHNLDFWVAVLRAVQFTCRTLGTKYAKKLQVLDYNAALTDAKNLCICEDERRMNIPEDQWNIYASLLCDKCEEHIATDSRDSLPTKLFLSAVQDILKGALYPTFDFPGIEDCMNVIREHKSLSDDIVSKSIDLLNLVVTNKVPLIDAKILLIENSRISLLNDLVRLSVFDYRSYILRPLKDLLLSGLKLRFFKEVAEAEANLLLKEEEKLQSKKKKNKSNKRASTSISSPLDKIVEHDPIELEDSMEQKGTNGDPNYMQIMPGQDSLSKDMDSAHDTTLKKISPTSNIEHEDTLSGEISSNTNKQEEATKDMQYIQGEDSLSELAHGKAATRYNSALDMILKALCNIRVLKKNLLQNRQPFSENLEEVPYALREFFSAFITEQINEEGVYIDLLSKLLVSLEEVHSLSSGAAEVVVAILEFLHCWKSPEMESLVTRLFTLEEYEIMSCSTRNCRRKTNYPDQSSYGIVMSADSIRDLKSTFKNIKFEDILKLIRMEDKMLCDVKTGGCGNTNFIHHTITSCSPIFTIVLNWEKSETEKEMSETTNALDWEIDISRLYKGVEPNTKYRLVSMVGCGEEGKHICMTYKKNRWVSLSHQTLAEEGVGNWKSLVRFCGERKVRPEILFYEALQWPNK